MDIHSTPGQKPLQPQFVVQVICRQQGNKEEAHGSAFFVNEHQLLTCRHVIAPYDHLTRAYGSEYDSIEIAFNGRRLKCNKKYIFPHKKLDIAIISIEERLDVSLPVFASLEHHNAQTINDAYAWGYPFELEHELTHTKCDFEQENNVGSQGGPPWRVQIKASIPHGCSGGPVLVFRCNKWHCLAMTDLGGSQTGFSNSFPSNELIKFLDEYEIGYDKSALPNNPNVPHKPLWKRNAFLIKAASFVGMVGLLFISGEQHKTLEKRNENSRIDAITRSAQPRHDVSISKPEYAIPQGRCTINNIERFQNSEQFNILVLRYASVGEGTSQTSIAGYNIGLHNQRQIQKLFNDSSSHNQNWNDISLTSANVKVRFEPCFVESHENAINIGVAAKANLVIWGHVREAFIAGPDGYETTFPNLTVIDMPSITIDSLNRDDYVSARELVRLTLENLFETDARNLLLGLFAYRNARYGLALTYLEPIIQRTWPATDDSAALMSIVAAAYTIVGRHNVAVSTAQKALQLCNSKHCKVHRLADFTEAAYYHGGMTTIMKEAAEKAIILAHEINDKNALHKAEFYSSRHDIQSSLKLNTQSKNFDNNMQGVPCATIDETADDIEEGKFNIAENKLETVIRNAERTGDFSTEGTAQRMLQDYYIYRKQFTKAIQAGTRAAELWNRVGNHQYRAEAIAKIAVSQQEIGYFQSYKDNLLLAAQILKDSHGDRSELYCNILTRLALANVGQKSAIDYGNRALSCMDLTGGSYVSKSSALKSLATSYDIQGNQQKAMKYITLALEHCTKVSRYSINEACTELRQIRASLYARSGQMDNFLSELLSYLFDYLDEKNGLELSQSDREVFIKNMLDGFTLSLKHRRFDIASRIIALWRQTAHLASVNEPPLLDGRYLTELGDYWGAFWYYSRIYAIEPCAGCTMVQSYAREIATAGLTRLMHGASLEGCQGFLVRADMQFLTVGDIIFKYRNSCINSTTDVEALAREIASSSESIEIKVLRGNAIVRGYLVGGKPQVLQVRLF